MGGVFSCLALSLINNIDNIGVQIAYRTKGIKVPLSKNIWISAITFIITFSSTALGQLLGQFIPVIICKIIGTGTLCLMGLFMLLPERYNPLSRPEKADIDGSKVIDFKEASLLGLMVSINNTGASLGAGIAGMSPLHIGVFSALINFLLFWSGNFLVRIFSEPQTADKIGNCAGILLILTGMIQFAV